MLFSRCDSNKGDYAPNCGWVLSNQLKGLREKLRFPTEGNFLPPDYNIEIPYELPSLLDFPMDSELKMATSAVSSWQICQLPQSREPIPESKSFIIHISH